MTDRDRRYNQSRKGQARSRRARKTPYARGYRAGYKAGFRRGLAAAHAAPELTAAILARAQGG
jgi:flagellar biosynthesis/type III secretory pathway protein FliH